MVGRLDLLHRVAVTLAAPVGGPLCRFLDHATRTPLPELAADYVATFDHRKCCCLFLTYYAHGDTRKRGMALLALKQTYAAAGLQLTCSATSPGPTSSTAAATPNSAPVPPVPAGSGLPGDSRRAALIPGDRSLRATGA
jgi:Nitrate reductase delta subunit